MPARRTLTIWRGNSFELPIRLLDENGVVDLTGSVLTFRTNDGKTKALTLSSDERGSFAELALTASDTAGYVPGATTSYEIERVAGASQKTLLYGTLVLEGGVNG